MPPTIAISGMYQGSTQPVPLPAPPYVFDSTGDIFVVIDVVGSTASPTLTAVPVFAVRRDLDPVGIPTDCETREGNFGSTVCKKFPANTLDAATDYKAVATIVDSTVAYSASQLFSTLP